MLSKAYAMAPPPGGEGGGSAGDMLVQFMPIIFMFVIFYFLLIRPQQKKAAEHRSMLAAIKDGDRVVTGGGIHGRVVKVQDDVLVVEIAERVRIKVNRGSISEVKREGGADAKAEPAGKGNGDERKKA